MDQKGKNRLVIVLLSLIVAIGCGLCFIAGILLCGGEELTTEEPTASHDMNGAEAAQASGFDFDITSEGPDAEWISTDDGLELPVQSGAYDIPVATSVGYGAAEEDMAVGRHPLQLNVTHSGAAVGDKYPGGFSIQVTGEPFAYVTLTCDFSFSNDTDIYDLVLDGSGCAYVDFDIGSEGRITLRADYSRGYSAAAESISFKADGKPPKLFLGDAAAGENVLTGLSEPGAEIMLTAPGVNISSFADSDGGFELVGHVFVQGSEYVVTATDMLGNSVSQKFTPEKQLPVFDPAYEVPVMSVESAGSAGEKMATLTIAGTACPGTGVDIFVNGIYCMSVMSDDDGTWHAVVMVPVSETGYDVHAIYTR